MIDPILLTVVFVVLFVFSAPIGVSLAIAAALLFGASRVVLLLCEVVPWYIGRRQTRCLLRLRWAVCGLLGIGRIGLRSKVQRVVQLYGLTLDAADPNEAERLKALAADAVGVNYNVPSGYAGPLTCTHLARALTDHAGTTGTEAGARYGEAVLRAWPSKPPEPGPVRQGLRLLSRLVFWKSMPAVQGKVTGGLFVIVSARLSGDQAAQLRRADYPEMFLASTMMGYCRQAGLPLAWTVPYDLPLSAQRKLIALSRAFSAAPWLFAVTVALNPSIAKALLAARADKHRHEAARRAAAEEQARYDAAPKYDTPGSLTETQIEALLTENARPAILLRRVWPPGADVPASSWLGGLPAMPRDMDWPRRPGTGLPLHFLAQIDCAAMPRLKGGSPLPPVGHLLFFADITDSMDLTGEVDAVRVLHIPPGAALHKTPAPDDLPQLGHSGGKPSYYANDMGRRLYPKWPVTPHEVVNYITAEWGPTNPVANYDYRQAANERQAASIATVLPPRPDRHKRVELIQRRYETGADGARKAGPPQCDWSVLGPTFPYSGAYMQEVIDALRHSAEVKRWGAANTLDYRQNAATDGSEADAKRLTEAREALERANGRAASVEHLARDVGTLAPTKPPTAEQAQALRAWIDANLDHASSDIGGALSRALLRIAQRSVTEPELRALMPDLALAMHDRALSPSLEQSQHLMLGTAQRKTNSTELGGVRLLVLDSDYGVDFMFCDCGVIEFWIQPEDLAAGRFDRVTAASAGG